jgi:hypothetical protein
MIERAGASKWPRRRLFSPVETTDVHKPRKIVVTAMATSKNCLWYGKDVAEGRPNISARLGSPEIMSQIKH